MAAAQPRSVAVANRMYDQHVKPVEAAHLGEYALVTPDGEVVFAPTLLELAEIAQRMANNENFLYKVGDRAIATLL
jgi:hypothetical protein